MAIDLDKFQRLKEKSEKAKDAASKAQGALETEMKNLKVEFELETLEAAEAKLVELEEEERTLDEKYHSLLKDFEDKWQERI